MKTAKEILDIVNQYDAEKSSAILETILSEHLRGKVYIDVINNHVRELYFEREYYRLTMDAHFKPIDTLESFIEKWGFGKLVEYLTEREDLSRKNINSNLNKFHYL